MTHLLNLCGALVATVHMSAYLPMLRYGKIPVQKPWKMVRGGAAGYSYDVHRFTSHHFTCAGRGDQRTFKSGFSRLASTLRNASRPRKIRDFTVPKDTCKISAISS